MISAALCILSVLLSRHADQNISSSSKYYAYFKPDFFLGVLYYSDGWIRL